MEGIVISSDQFPSPLKIKKVNIGSPKNTNLANIRDYWDEETVGKVTELLHEFQDLFPTKFSKMKGIVRDLSEMKIPLRPDVKSVKKRPYILYLRYKEKVKAELDQLLEASVIEPAEESEWINLIVV